jgi:hypothetical protein
MAAVLASLTGLQREWGCGGSLVEVGVFRGASFFPLLLLSADGESVVGVDCFAGQQSANVDGSGFSAAVPSVTEFQRMMEQCVPEEEIRQRASILQYVASSQFPCFVLGYEVDRHSIVSFTYRHNSEYYPDAS